MMNTTRTIAGKLELPSLSSPPAVKRRVFVSFPLRKVLLCLCDLVLVNVALFLALILRDFWLPEKYAVTQYFTMTRTFVGFNILHVGWIFVLYSVGLYDIERFTSRRDLLKRIALALTICGIIGITLFYTVNHFRVTPKVFRMPPRIVLALDLAFLTVLLFATRQLFMQWGGFGRKMRLMICGNGTETAELRGLLERKRHLGYKVCDFLPLENPSKEELPDLQRLIQGKVDANEVDVIAVTRKVSDNEAMREFFYRLLCSGAHVVDFNHLYEEVTGKIPSSLINEGWFVGSVRAFNKRGFEVAKRMLDLSAAIVLGVPTLLFFPFIAALIKLESPGPVLFRQRRVGRDGRVFEVVKFRTMVPDAERNGAQWTMPGDNRITRVGGFLRKTRIDELPQLWNVLSGEMSLVGPRPERPEFVDELNERIPFFAARNIVRPGLTGWAQISFGYGSSETDALEKLQYDLYYIKHRSIALELSILLKTASTIVRFEGR
jgi:exopolysaccharide biosynthesis polyprenyl glycosylphosphotransferase